MLYDYKSTSLDESVLIKQSFVIFIILLHNFSNLSLNIKVELSLTHSLEYKGLKNVVRL